MSDRKWFSMGARALLSGLAFGILLTGSAMTAQAGPPEFDEFPALREAPSIPLGSVILRRAFPDHPVAAPIADEFPGEVGFPEEGSSIGSSPIVNGRAVSGDSTCDKDVDLTGQIGGVVSIAARDTGFCTNADIDSYVGNDGGTYVVQAGGQERVFTLTEVTDPANPVVLWQLYFTRSAKGTYTPDVKAFHIGSNDYIVVGLERTKLSHPCGVLFFDVTDLTKLPVMGAQFIGSGWCDVHNVFVEKDPTTGDGLYVYVTADNTNDLRVLDISDVASPTEVGSYTAPEANNSNYVHDVTVVNHGGNAGRRVYLSYWDSGLVILDAADVTPGADPTPLLGPGEPGTIDPGGFLTHHAVPSADGNLVFIQDEFLDAPGDEPVQMWDVSDLDNPNHFDSLVLGTDVGLNPAHNLEIRYDIDPPRLYVGWYKLGLQAWDFSPAGFERIDDTPSSAIYHQVQTEASDDAYSGTWGVRLAKIGGVLYIFQSDRNFGLIVDCEGCAAAPKGTVTGTITDSSTSSSPIVGASVVADGTGQSATTDSNGVYTLSNVPTGTQTVTASATGFDTQQNTNVVVVESQTTSNVDFALDPSVTSGGFGSIKGTVTDSISGAKLGGVSLETDTGETATTNRGGKYTIRNVPEGTRTVTANRTDYVFGSDEISVTAGQTSTLNFSLVPQSP